MKLITRDTDYALRALYFISKNPGRPVAVTELVRALKMPRPFLRKLLQLLSRKKILASHKGKGGGFSLNLPKEKIRLVELMRTFQGPLKLNECTFKKSVCPNIKKCLLSRKICAIEKMVVKKLSPITLANLK